ncbi:unnamed protein product [Ambrosiozyma monospora]|uniref:Unnamed protein product n=1 Tax=Ambrosiozyma monospora TaxID=43982 RepID=A0A9W6WGL8_AMBMO|nr:unnamed protein product [Ambrosiozyma monospora]
MDTTSNTLKRKKKFENLHRMMLSASLGNGNNDSMVVKDTGAGATGSPSIASFRSPLSDASFSNMSFNDVEMDMGQDMNSYTDNDNISELMNYNPDSEDASYSHNYNYQLTSSPSPQMVSGSGSDNANGRFVRPPLFKTTTPVPPNSLMNSPRTVPEFSNDSNIRSIDSFLFNETLKGKPIAPVYNGFSKSAEFRPGNPTPGFSSTSSLDRLANKNKSSSHGIHGYSQQMTTSNSSPVTPSALLTADPFTSSHFPTPSSNNTIPTTPNSSSPDVSKAKLMRHANAGFYISTPSPAPPLLNSTNSASTIDFTSIRSRRTSTTSLGMNLSSLSLSLCEPSTTAATNNSSNIMQTDDVGNDGDIECDMGETPMNHRHTSMKVNDFYLNKKQRALDISCLGHNNSTGGEDADVEAETECGFEFDVELDVADDKEMDDDGSSDIFYSWEEDHQDAT